MLGSLKPGGSCTGLSRMMVTSSWNAVLMYAQFSPFSYEFLTRGGRFVGGSC